MRDDNGLVHAVEAHEDTRYSGILACGRPYQKKVPRNRPVNKHVVFVTRTMSQPTCLWCITGTAFPMP